MTMTDRTYEGAATRSHLPKTASGRFLRTACPRTVVVRALLGSSNPRTAGSRCKSSGRVMVAPTLDTYRR